MSEPVNLNKRRKAQARADGKARARANAIKFGRNKAQTDLEKARAEKFARDVDGHKREP